VRLETIALAELADLEKLLAPQQRQVLDEFCNQAPGLVDCAQYVLSTHSIDVRPLLFRCAHQLGHKPFSQVIPIAIALHLASTATIVADDILDHADRRENKPAAHAAFGLERALILSEALKSIASNVFLRTLKQESHLVNKYEAYWIFEKAFGELYRGQYLDIMYQGQTNVSEDSYYAMIRLSTGSLLEASLVIGGLLAGLPRSTINQLTQFGAAFGYMHQLRDDFVDYWPGEYDLGRQMGEDLRQRKQRLPIIYCLRKPSVESTTLRQILRKRVLDSSDVRRARNVLERSGAFQYVRQQISNQARVAIKSLVGLKRGRWTTCLKALVQDIAAV
jgi:geranylgeranyl pyrophosphate synthase